MTDPACSYCGGILPASSRVRRYCSDRCRRAAFRRRHAGQGDAAPLEEVAGEPGRARAGLEAWAFGAPEAPAALLEAARLLADQIDSRPSDSPLWARYIDLLRLLVPAVSQPALDEEAVALLASFRSRETAESYRAERYAEAKSDGARRRWERMVPLGCSRDQHAWRGKRCTDCGLERPRPMEAVR
jgi:hypothetical protein